jgi:hypothetical protein
VLRTLLVVGALAFTGSAQAATGDGAALAKALKPDIVKLYKQKAPSYTFTTVTCVLPSGATIAHCKAHFTITSERVVGLTAITANIDRSTGGVRWRETKRTCKDAKTGAPVGC